MTPRTRSGNKEIDYTVYYSKKVPQQVRFPHKRKIVRRRSTSGQDGADKRQMVFLPDKMRRSRTTNIRDSDQGSEDDLEELQDDGAALQQEIADKGIISEQRTEQKSRKRKSETFGTPAQASSRDEQEQTSAKRQRRSGKAVATPTIGRNLRRQSTMTQIIDGRRPLSDDEEPVFQSTKRRTRMSSGGGPKEKDKRQRTLTQMVSGMQPLDLVSDEDLQDAGGAEAEEEDSQEYDEAIARRLAQQGFYQVKGVITKDTMADKPSTPNSSNNRISGSEDAILDLAHEPAEIAVLSVEDTMSDGEESYQPTQFIEAPATRTRRTRRKNADTYVSSKGLDKKGTAGKTRFGLLATPEKQRIREIPSSQSPADSPLSAQVSPEKTQRLPLQECTGNVLAMGETTSSRKRVAFAEPKSMPPPSLRKFESTIQDSEDEEDEIVEELRPLPRHHAAAETIDASTRKSFVFGQTVGTETQAMIEQIDQACAGRDDDELEKSRQSPAGSVDLKAIADIFLKTEPSQLGADAMDLTLEADPQGSQNEMVKMEKGHVAIDTASNEEQIRSTPPVMENYPQETFPSTPMALPDESSDEEDAASPSPARTNPRGPTNLLSTTDHHSADLDGQPVQVPRSPSPNAETQHSYSSRAEQQLHHEWLSYSQYINTRRPGSSSMQVAHDASTYDATPRPPRPAATQPSARFTSQATTVDEATQRTPSKDTHHQRSQTTPPQRIPSSVSPVKPPPLFIPSSFPSPSRAAMEEWSSPVLYGRTQDGGLYGASLEDFSIPLPPPAVSVDEDEDEEDGEEE
ncbi:hypothetical protein ACN47E_003816 [Coniothyrium glycines]